MNSNIARILQNISRFPTPIHLSVITKHELGISSRGYYGRQIWAAVPKDRTLILFIVATARESFKMDATKKPLLIPPEFSNYAEKHGIFQIYEVRDH